MSSKLNLQPCKSAESICKAVAETHLMAGMHEVGTGVNLTPPLVHHSSTSSCKNQHKKIARLHQELSLYPGCMK